MMKIFNNNKIVVIDTETGGLDSNNHSILSIAMIVLDTTTLKIEDKINFYINEEKVIVTKEAYKLNLIELNKIFSPASKSIENAKNEILKFIKKNFIHPFFRLLPTKMLFGYLPRITLCGKNVEFDYKFLKRIFKGEEILYFSYRKIDLSSIVEFLKITGKLVTEKSGLYYVAKYLGFDVAPLAPLHDALYDAELTAKIFCKLIEIDKNPFKAVIP